MPQLEYAGLTDVGRRRDHNEDAFGLIPEQHLFVVADGLGGYAAGEVASKLAVESIAGFIQQQQHSAETTDYDVGDVDESDDKSEIRHVDGSGATDRLDHERVLIQAITSANQRVHRAATRYRAYHGMATTIVSMHLVDEHCVVAHVGDSRCYRLRQGVLTRLTEDHSLLNDYRNKGNLEFTEETFPLRNVIMRAIGKDASVEVDVSTDVYAPGDIYILCTDGLTGELKDDTIAQLAATHIDDLEAMSQALVQAACDAGGRDNVTVVAVKVRSEAR